MRIGMKKLSDVNHPLVGLMLRSKHDVIAPHKELVFLMAITGLFHQIKY